jgi:hypothetical protein
MAALNEAGAGIKGLEQPPTADQSPPGQAGPTAKRPLKLPGFNFVPARYGARRHAAAAPLVQDSAQVKALREEILAGVHAAVVNDISDTTVTAAAPELTEEELRAQFRSRKAAMHQLNQRARKAIQVQQYNELSRELTGIKSRSGMHLAQLHIVLTVLSIRGVKMPLGWQRLVSDECSLVLPAAAVRVHEQHYVSIDGIEAIEAYGRRQLLQSASVLTTADTGSGMLNGVQLLFCVQPEHTTLRKFDDTALVDTAHASFVVFCSVVIASKLASIRMTVDCTFEEFEPWLLTRVQLNYHTRRFQLLLEHAAPPR